MGVYLFRIPCRRLPSLPRQREVKPRIADDTALVGCAYVLFVLRFAIECSLNILHILGIAHASMALRSTFGTPVEK